MKICSHCNQEKNESEFYVRSRIDPSKGLSSRCKQCNSAVQQTPERRARDNEIHKQKYASSETYRKRCNSRSAEWHRRNKAKIAAHNRFKKYGLNAVDYARLRFRQQYKCAICERTTDLAIDHCHATGVTRGILCRPCNNAIGLLQDNPALCTAASEYLKNPPNLQRTTEMRSTREVTLVVETTHVYIVPDTASDEDAISTAEQLLLEDGDQGDVQERDIISGDAYELDEAA